MTVSRIAAAALGVMALACAPAGARADHALLRDGRGLFNVLVLDEPTTRSTLVRVRARPDSFQYDYEANLIKLLPRREDHFDVADVVTTRTQFGKEQARLFMHSRGWHRYVAPAVARIEPPTPDPTPTPTPVPTPIPNPQRVASAELAPSERTLRQREMFLAEQTDLSSRVRFAELTGNLAPKDGKDARLALLNDQLLIVDTFYKEPHEEFRRLRADVEQHRQRVEASGTFLFE